MRAEHYERLERIAEAIRRLAWGPDEEAAKAETRSRATQPENLSASRALARLPTSSDGSWRDVG